MSMMTNQKRKGVVSDINITPYIDILLVLLIIFMVASPLKKHEEDIRVPQPPPETKEQTKPDLIIVDIAKDHTIKINNLNVTIDELGPKLVTIFSARANKNMFIRGDVELAYGEVFRILDIAKRSGVVDIALLRSDGGAAKPTVAMAR